MKFDIDEMVKSKEAFRQRLAALPIGEKLRMLDTLRERALVLRRARSTSSIVREEASNYTAQRRAEQ